jgi:CO/xanthine dehydrogenase FAD-binding subunit
MVALGVGRLTATSLLSIQHLRELRFLRLEDDALHLGAGTTFTDIRRSAEIARDFPLLARAASWTGSIANQNRGTLGGNLCNASPAADTPPALLAYDATVTLISASGQRTLPYSEFHLGYKRTALRPEELLYSVTVPRAFHGWRQYLRKVGTRNAQAISKTALAAVARIEDQRIEEVRIGAASLADRPLRCATTEAALRGASLASGDLEDTVRAARAALAREAMPSGDIRSTGRYRSHVAENLLEEFVRSLAV